MVSHLGEAADKLSFTVTNHDKSPVKYDFSSGKQFDVVVTDSDNKPVWSWSTGRMFPQLITHLTLNPGQSRTFTVVWKRLDDGGKPVPGGTYTATATLTSMPRTVISRGPLVNSNTATTEDPTNVGVGQISTDPNNTSVVSSNAAVQNNITPSVSAKTTIIIQPLTR